jgi:virginiamycin B lyase
MRRFPYRSRRLTVMSLAVAAVAAMLAVAGPHAAAASRRPCRARCVTRFVLPSTEQSFGITHGPRQSEWFSMDTAIGRINPAGVLSTYPVPGTTGEDVGWLTAHDGVIWFAERAANKIGRITASGAIRQYAIPTPAAVPQAIVVGPDGDVYFTEQDGNAIGRLDPATGAMHEFAIPTASSRPIGLALGPDGALWFTENSASQIGRMTLGGHFTEFPLAAGAAPYRIVLGPDRALWVTELAAGKVGRISTSGRLKEYPISGGPVGITAGRDGELYVVLFTDHVLARVNQRGSVTRRWVLHGATGPLQVATGRGLDVWVTDGFAPNVYRVTPYK